MPLPLPLPLPRVEVLIGVSSAALDDAFRPLVGFDPDAFTVSSSSLKETADPTAVELLLPKS